VLSVPATLEAAMPALMPKLQSQGPEKVAAFLAKFGDRLSREQREDASSGGFQALLDSEAGGGRPTLDHILAAYAKARELGIEPARLEEPRIRFVEITSRTLLKEGQIEFPPSIDIDLPVDAGKANLDEALSEVGSDRLDYLVVLDVAVAKSFRRVASQDKVSSQYQSGVRYEPNPA
jgi:hypothetical protein